MQELPVVAIDNHAFRLRLFPAVPARAIVVICPAMGVQASYYDRFAEALVQRGVSVAITDLRGQGSSSLRASRDVDWGYADMVEKDWPAMIAGVRAEWPGLPLYLFGHSQGGQLALLYLARQPSDVAGVITIACGSTYFRGWPFPHSLRILAQTQFVRGPAAVLGYFPGNKLGFGGRQARSEMRDWANAAINGRYDLIGAGMDYEAGLKNVMVPARLFSLEGDDFAPRGAAAFLAGKLPAAQVQHRHLGPDELPAEARDHFRWSRHPDAVIPFLLSSVELA